MAIQLSVNLNKIALLRNSRPENFPDPCEFAILAIEAGADGITLHPRSDLRHIRPHDITAIKKILSTHELNLEGNPLLPKTEQYPGFLPLLFENQPDQCTLVPDSQDQQTSDHGWNLAKDYKTLEPIFAAIKKHNIRLSIFMDRHSADWQLAKNMGVDRVELYTADWAKYYHTPMQQKLATEYQQAAKQIFQAGLGLNAGHDLNQKNLAPLTKWCGLKEVSIGHALIAESLQQGFQRTVRAYKTILQSTNGHSSKVQRGQT